MALNQLQRCLPGTLKLCRPATRFVPVATPVVVHLRSRVPCLNRLRRYSQRDAVGEEVRAKPAVSACRGRGATAPTVQARGHGRDIAHHESVALNNSETCDAKGAQHGPLSTSPPTPPSKLRQLGGAERPSECRTDSGPALTSFAAPGGLV